MTDAADRAETPTSETLTSETLTSETPTPEQCMEVVEASPARVGARDKAAWLDLFAADAVVEDPVGTRPHHAGARPRGRDGEDELGRFYEVFIAPNQIRFDVLHNLVAPPWVARDVRIHTQLPNGYRVEVPAHILYEVTLQEGVPKIRHLAAYWELRRMPRLALSGGFKGLMAVNRQTFRMLRIQRLGGMAGYLRGFRTLGRKGRPLVHRLAETLTARDRDGLAALFADDTPRVELQPGRPLTPAALLEALGPEAALAVDDLRVAGSSLSFGFTLGSGERPQRGIGVLDLQRRPTRITRARLFGAVATG